MDEVLEVVIDRTAKDGTPFRVCVMRRGTSVYPLAQLNGEFLAHGNQACYPLPKAAHASGFTHAAGYPPARVIGLTAAEAQAVEAAVTRHHQQTNAAEIAKQQFDDKLGALLEELDAARAKMDFTRARKIESQIAVARRDAGLPANGWRE